MLLAGFSLTNRYMGVIIDHTVVAVPFATSLDEVVLTLFVAGPNQRTLARQMFSSIRENISPAIAAAAFLFIAGTVLIGLVVVVSRSIMAERR